MYQINIKNTYKRQEKKKLTKFIFIITIIISIMLIIALTTYSNKPVKYVNIRVEPGQSLWNIATKYNTKEEDIRKLIYKIKKVNDMKNVLLQPGQTIKIPIKK